MKGFRGRYLELSGELRIVANSGSALFVSCGLMASMYGVFFGLLAEMGGRCSCYIGVIAELNGCCYCAPGHSQAADLLRSGASGFAGPLEHVAAAPLVSSGHSDLLVASAAKATEYMLETAAASVAAFADHVLNTLLLESGALACGYLFYRNDSHAAAAATAALFGKFLCVPFSKCVSEFVK